jgi:hypothetical protein
MMSIRALFARVPVGSTTEKILCVQKPTALIYLRPVTHIQDASPKLREAAQQL